MRSTLGTGARGSRCSSLPRSSTRIGCGRIMDKTRITSFMAKNAINGQMTRLRTQNDGRQTESSAGHIRC